MTAPIHIVDGYEPKDVDVVVSWCGKTATITPDAEVHPSDFDFVSPPWECNATCPACISSVAAWRQRQPVSVGALFHPMRPSK